MQENLAMTEARSDAWLALAALPFLLWLAESMCLTLLNLSLVQLMLGQIASGAMHLAYISGVFLAVMGILTNTPLSRRITCLGLMLCYAWFVVSA